VSTDPIEGCLSQNVLADRLYVYRFDLSNLSGLPSAPLGTGIDTSSQLLWKNYQANLLTFLTSYTQSHTSAFYIEFEPTGALNRTSAAAIPLLLVVERAADGQVTQYAFYPMNANNGVPLVFE